MTTPADWAEKAREVHQAKPWTCDQKTCPRLDPAALNLGQDIWFTWSAVPLPKGKGWYLPGLVWVISE